MIFAAYFQMVQEERDIMSYTHACTHTHIHTFHRELERRQMSALMNLVNGGWGVFLSTFLFKKFQKYKMYKKEHFFSDVIYLNEKNFSDIFYDIMITFCDLGVIIYFVIYLNEKSSLQINMCNIISLSLLLLIP